MGTASYWYSYNQGYREAAQDLGNDEISVYSNTPDVAEEYLDQYEYLRGRVAAILFHLKKANALS